MVREAGVEPALGSFTGRGFIQLNLLSDEIGADGGIRTHGIYYLEGSLNRPL